MKHRPAKDSTGRCFERRLGRREEGESPTSILTVDDGDDPVLLSWQMATQRLLEGLHECATLGNVVARPTTGWGRKVLEGDDRDGRVASVLFVHFPEHEDNWLEFAKAIPLINETLVKIEPKISPPVSWFAVRRNGVVFKADDERNTHELSMVEPCQLSEIEVFCLVLGR